MKNKRILFLFAAIVFFAVSHAQEAAPAETPKKNNFSYGVKANMAYVGIHKNKENDGGNTIFQNDYSVFAIYKHIGIFGGYSAVFGYNNYSTTKATKTLSGFNAGVIFQLYQSKNKQHGFSISVYDVHYSATNPNYPANLQPSAPDYYNIYYKEGMNFVYINPRYQYNFCNGLLTAEFGLQHGFHLHDIKFKQNPNDSRFFTYNNRLSAFAFVGGMNLSIACNLSQLTAKK